MLAAGVIAVFAVTLAVFLLIWPPVKIIGNRVIKLHPWRFDSLLLDDLSQIDFHYDGVGCIGFQFISKSGKSMMAEANAVDQRLLSSLEKRLPRFSKADFYKQFSDGYSDSFIVWRNV